MRNIFANENCRKYIEIAISVLSLLLGGLFIYNSIYLMYAYHFTDKYILESFSIPMTVLVPDFLSGILLFASPILLWKNREKGIQLFKVTGIMFLLHAINLIVIGTIRYGINDIVILLFVSFIRMFPIGLILYLYFGKVSTTKISLKVWIVCCLIYIVIDLLFFNWYYIDFR